jgi:FG-GAP-like repeat
MKKSILVIICACLAFLCGCSGGGGKGNSAAPSITRLDAFSYQSGVLSVSLDFLDPGEDIATITAGLYDAHHTLMGLDTSSIEGIAGQTSGTINGDLDFSSLAIGDYSLDIYLTDSGGLKSNVVSKAFSATGGFGTAVNYPNPVNYLYLGNTAIGDLYGNGRNDVVAIQGSNNTGLVLIYYQNASGGLDSPVSLNTDILPSGVAIADVNNDGKADLVLCGLGINVLVGHLGRIAVYLQEPTTGQLKAPIEYTVSSDYNVHSLVVADLNADGRNDVAVVAPQTGADSYISIFFQDDTGSLGTEVIYGNGIVGPGSDFKVADMNNDGNNDIVLRDVQNQLTIAMQVSPGVFSTTPDQYAVQIGNITVGDLNGDGLNDVLATGPGNSGFFIFPQNSSGKLDAPIQVPISDQPYGMQLADITGDGLNDMILDVSGGIALYPQKADHTFGDRKYYSYYSMTYGGSSFDQGLSIGDINGDGMPEAIVPWVAEGLYVFPSAVELVVH